MATNILDIMLHLDKYLNVIIQSLGLGTYLILFLVLFCETGLVITPFLPGDSLLFTAGAIAAIGSLDIAALFLTLATAAIAGDSVNYFIGKSTGYRIIKGNTRLVKPEYIVRAQDFYARYGSITIFLARFIPIIRTFAPFVAGIGEMKYTKFLSYNIFGGLVWTGLFLCGGYFFGNLPAVKQNFSVIIFAIIFISLLPAIIGFIQQKWAHD